VFDTDFGPFVTQWQNSIRMPTKIRTYRPTREAPANPQQVRKASFSSDRFT